ncbi:hypothetical protein TVAG_271820 [Trichomonas vaginalis G3]|uniref:Exocyst complex component Sec8 n=1 Tax=Trichomonas vaginalis (strain ATCC PRA-98 / G3) TaxID=412133 RepID=A2E5S9_TRIV3|nr:exocyst complex component 4 family [Trichomonas vaginalis G3]EAY11999.1 hypothetical protein TVAG_271820 [Trichomonas vaginalis G3]KAI5524826.1 exocyst complex component 4 family [Trichomonas vaginalis G3]|eukprot:XP_001324222.1 hypothetical protein [Trichomonas vaginalis G3]
MKKVNWDEINRFIKNDCSQVISYGFNPYDFAVENWNNGTNAGFNVDDLLRQSRTFALQIADEYAVPLEVNAKTYTKKAELRKEIDDFLAAKNRVIEKTRARFTIDPEDLKQKWLKTVKLEKEIELFEQVENLVTVSPIVYSKIEQGKHDEAVRHICEELQIYSDRNFHQIESLDSVKEGIDKARSDMVGHVMNSLFSLLFIKQRLPGISFFRPYPHSEIRIPRVDTSQIEEYTILLICLEIQNDFFTQLRETVRDRLALLMSETAESIKVQKIRQFAQSKDGFEELVDIANNYNMSHPLVMFIDQLLSKMWVLMSRCKAFDQVFSVENTNGVAFANAYAAVDELIRDIVTAFTSVQGSITMYTANKLSYKFLSSETAHQNSTASQLRSELGIKPCSANSLHIFMMLDDFNSCLKEKYNISYSQLSNKMTIDLDVKKIFADQTKLISDSIDVSRPVKIEAHPVPVLISTPLLLDNIEKYGKIAGRFTYLQDMIIGFMIQFLKAFISRCLNEIGHVKSAESQEQILSSRILTSDKDIVLKYLGKVITTELVLKDNMGDYEDNIKDLSQMEEQNELDLVDKSQPLTIENTIREKFCLPTIAATAESIVVIKNSIESLLISQKYTDSNNSAIRSLITELEQTLVRAMIFIRLEMRCRTYVDIIQPLLNGNYTPLSSPTKPDQYVTDFISTYNSSTDNIGNCLTPARNSFVFIGIARLVYNIHIRYGPRIREISDKGAAQLTMNLSALNQHLSSIQYPEQSIYKKTLVFVSNISYSTDRILMQIAQQKDLFTYEEMEPVFNMQQKMNEHHAENLDKLRQLLKK